MTSLENLCITVKIDDDIQSKQVSNLLADMSCTFDINVNYFKFDLSINNYDSRIVQHINNINSDLTTHINLTAFVDARGLACPMPLLKTKVALRKVASSNQLYLVASDKNTQHDITAFCRHGNHSLTSWQTVHDTTANDGLIYHFIVGQ